MSSAWPDATPTSTVDALLGGRVRSERVPGPHHRPPRQPLSRPPAMASDPRPTPASRCHRAPVRRARRTPPASGQSPPRTSGRSGAARTPGDARSAQPGQVDPRAGTPPGTTPRPISPANATPNARHGPRARSRGPRWSPGAAPPGQARPAAPPTRSAGHPPKAHRTAGSSMRPGSVAGRGAPPPVRSLVSSFPPRGVRPSGTTSPRPDSVVSAAPSALGIRCDSTMMLVSPVEGWRRPEACRG